MGDGEDDDDQPRQRERQRQQSRSRERVHPHVPVPQESQIQPMRTQNLMMRYQMRILPLLIPHHQLNHHSQLNRGIAREGQKDSDHVSEDIHVHPHMLANNNNLLYLLQKYSRIRQLRPKMKIQ